MRNERFSVSECIRRAKALGIPTRMGRGAHFLLCPPGEPSVNVSIGHKNDIANPRAMKLIRRYELARAHTKKQEKTMPVDAPADIRLRAGAAPEPAKLEPVIVNPPEWSEVKPEPEPPPPSAPVDPIGDLQRELNQSVADAKEARHLLDEAVGRIKKHRDRLLDMVSRANRALKDAVEA